jgi:hypothetical protein
MDISCVCIGGCKREKQGIANFLRQYSIDAASEIMLRVISPVVLLSFFPKAVLISLL